MLSLLARMPAGADIDHDRLVATLRQHSVHLGTAWVDDTLQSELNHGDTLADQPALANLVDTLLNRIFDLPVIARPRPSSRAGRRAETARLATEVPPETGRTMTAPTITPPRQKRSGRKAGQDPDDWWNLPDTVPAQDSATVRKGRRWRRLITGYVWAAVILLPLALLAVFVLAGKQLAGDDTAPDRIVSATQEAAQAQVALERWMAQDPSPLPGGRVVALIDATSQTPAPTRPGETVDYRIATYRFVVADKQQTLYTTGVQLAITPDGPVLLAQPALLPIPTTGSGAQGGQWPWPGVDAGTAQTAYAAAVNAWLAAYTSGDPAALKQAIGDPDATRSYLPLSGVRLVVAVDRTRRVLVGQRPEPR